MDNFSSHADVTTVAAATSETVLIAKNNGRNSGSVYNDSAASLYLKLGAGATITDWTVRLDQDDYYELPEGYAGDVTGVWAAASGQARVTETV